MVILLGLWMQNFKNSFTEKLKNGGNFAKLSHCAAFRVVAAFHSLKIYEFFCEIEVHDHLEGIATFFVRSDY